MARLPGFPPPRVQQIRTRSHFRSHSARRVLLEPVMRAEVIMREYVGARDRRRGNIRCMSQRRVNQVIDPDVLLAEMFGYIDSLRSLTAGHGSGL